MGAHAVGAYLRVLREARGMGRVALAQELGVNPGQIEQLEKAVHTPRGPFLFAVARAVHGNLEHVDQLMLDTEATVEMGQQLARAWLAQQREQETQPELWQQAQELLAQLGSDLYLLERLIGYADRLIDENAAASAESSALFDPSDPQGDESHTDEDRPG